MMIDQSSPRPDLAPKVRGTKSIYKVIALREWSDPNTLVAVGDETTYTPGNEVPDYEKKLFATYDYVRMHP